MTSTSADNTFHLLRSHRIEALNVTVEEYEHRPTGASHIHLAADNDENVFLVAFRTVPHDSTGVAHILEHTVLCGSEKYPVRDPFFMMIRRSLNTFMNAMTSSDWTAFPFASQNRKDFDNLLEVYLDAVFFSRLDPLDFAQEGHRLEFAEADNPKSDLVYKGVVFNEMKGAMSSVPAQLWQTMCKYLNPTTTYHHNSGGEPESIVDLSYEQLRHFYRTHYHPTNAMFMTFGDIPAAEHQRKIEALALNRFEKLPDHIFVPAEKRYHAPIRVQEAYPYSEDKEEGEADEIAEDQLIPDRTHIVMGWLLGKTTDLEATLEAHLLTSVLFDNSASPLQQALETTDLGSAPSPLCGLEDSQYELTFVCGLEGSNPDSADDFEALVLNTLKKVAEEGVPYEEVKASLHQLELQQRETGGDGSPYGLQLALTALTAATHRGDPIGLLDIDPVLNKLREAIKDPDYVKKLANDLLVNNRHRVRLTMVPDPQLADLKVRAEADQLAEIKRSLTPDQQQTITERALALQARQTQKDDLSILPKVGLEDIPKEMRHKEGERKQDKKLPVALYQAGTNGLTYQQAVVDLPALNEEELTLLPLLCLCITELGLADSDYLATQRRQSQVVGSINCYTSIRGQVNDPQRSLGHLILSAKALADNHPAMTELLADTLYAARFDEVNRIRELIAQFRARRESSVTGNGHVLAMNAAAAGMSPVAQLSHRLSGLAGIQAIKKLDDALKDPQQLQKFAEGLQALHLKLCRQPIQFLLVSEEAHLNQQYQGLEETWSRIPDTSPASDTSDLILPVPEQQQIRQGWLASTQVNFCAKAFPTVPMTHTDAAPLTVLGGFLRNGFLHTAIREQGGAYGAGAQQDSNTGTFRFFSYRDPRMVDTLKDFDKSLQWLMDGQHDWQSVEEAILGVVSSIDRPASPAGEAKQAFHSELHGRSVALREAFRQQVLQVKAEDLQRVANDYLLKGKESIVVVTGQGNQAAVSDLQLAIKRV